MSALAKVAQKMGFKDRLKKALSEGAGKVGDFMKENPKTTVGTAVGLGAGAAVGKNALDDDGKSKKKKRPYAE